MIDTGFGADGTPFTVTTTLTVPLVCPLGSTSKGICALSCESPPGITLRMAASLPPKETLTPPSEVEKGTLSPAARGVAKFGPKIETKVLPATADPRHQGSYS